MTDTTTQGPWHIRYSVKTTSLFSGLGRGDPIQHAVDNESIKTLCGRNASELWKLGDGNEFDNNRLLVTCSTCCKKLDKGGASHG